MNTDYFRNINYIKHIPPERFKRVTRSGIIPYCLYRNKVWISMAVDSRSGDLCDFGGQVNDLDCTPIDTALREFTEESLCAHGLFKPEDLKDSVCSLSERSMLIFLHVRAFPARVMSKFKEKAKACQRNLEVKDIKFFDLENFKKIMDNQPARSMTDKIDTKYIIYSEVRRLLCQKIFLLI